jgi:glucose/arabinose dehydrogenase
MIRSTQVAVWAALSGVGASACGSSTQPADGGSNQTQTTTEAGKSGTTATMTGAMQTTGTSAGTTGGAATSGSSANTGNVPSTSAGSGSASTTPDMQAAGGPAEAAAGTGAPPASGSGEPFKVPTTCGAATPNATVGNPCPGTPPPAIKLTLVADGLVAPTFAAQAPGDPSRFYVIEQRGTMRVIEEGALKEAPVLDLRDLSGAAVNNAEIVPGSYGEGGLLGLVFDPQFETTQRFWVSYTTAGPNFVVAEFKLTAPDTADVASHKELLSFQNFPFSAGDATNHVGSSLAFGPDGCLYVSRGEGGGENDSHNSGQSTEDDLASMLRIDVDKFPTPAPGNMVGHIWSYGFRNPWRVSFDRVTGDLYIGDVGQDVGSGFEEINVDPRGVVGRNYGWSETAGPSGGTPEMIKPIHSYPITQTENSVIGGYVYRGSKMPEMVGRYIWADWTERKIKTLVYKGETGGQPEACDMHDTNVTAETKVRSFAEGLDGEIYVLAGGPPTAGLIGSAAINQMGSLYRIEPQ